MHTGDELARLYAEHSRTLLQLAVLLVPDVGAAREVMYEAFVALDSGRRYRTRSDGDAFVFLLRDVVRRARAIPPGLAPVTDPVLGALRSLPPCQREALVLHYYGQLPDWQAAAAMGIRQSELRAYVDRGMDALRAALVPPGREAPELHIEPVSDHIRCLLWSRDGGLERMVAAARSQRVPGDRSSAP